MSSPEPAGLQEKILVWLLRIGGVMTALAIPTAFLSATQMAEIHALLGMGEFPVTPITGYMARSLSLLYGFHGVLLLVISTDVRRYRKLVVALAWLMAGLGPGMLWIDLHSGMPLFWTLSEGPPLIAMALVMLYLSRSIPADR